MDERYTASDAGRTCRITVLNPFDAARSRMSVSSVRCASALRLERDGQSMFATVATQTPRISRAIGGGAVSAGAGTAGPEISVGPLAHAAVIEAVANQRCRSFTRPTYRAEPVVADGLELFGLSAPV